MRVLVISTNRSGNPISVLPFGACIVAEAAERAGHRAELLDLMFEGNPRRAVADALSRHQPEVVGISIRNIDNNDIIRPRAYLDDVLPIVDILRERSDAEIVLGGAAVTVMPEHILRRTGVRWAATGNGETVFPAFLSAIFRRSDPRTVPGIAWIEGGRFRSNPHSGETLSRAPMPDFRRWVNMSAYLSRMTSVPVQTRRGCPFACVYCTYAISEGRMYRLFDPGSVVDGIRNLTAAGFRDIEFVDNVFNSPYAYALDLCHRFSGARLDARMVTMELNPKFLDDTLLDAMERAGFVGIGVTPESADDSVLVRLGKNYTAAEVAASARVVRNHGVPCFWIFMLGGPGETRETVLRTIEFAERHIRRSDTVFFNIGVRIYPGTPLEAIARSEGVLTVPREEMLDPVFYVSSTLDTDWLMGTVRDATRRNPHFISQETFSLPFLPGVFGFLRRFGFTPPAWKYTGRLRRGFHLAGIRT